MMTKAFAARVRKDFLRLSVLSLVIVVIWLVLTTYRALNRSQTAPDVKKQLQPLTATLPLDTIDQVSGRLTSPVIDWASLNLEGPVLLASPSAL